MEKIEKKLQQNNNNLKIKNIDVRDSIRVVISNKLIESNELSNLSCYELKILMLAIAQVRKNDHYFYQYKATARQLLELFEKPDNRKRSQYTSIKRACIKLKDFKICIDNRELQVFKKCEYNNSLLYFQLHEDLRPFLLHINGHYNYYTQPLLRDLMKLENKYSILFWIFIQKESCNRSKNIINSKFENLDIDILLRQFNISRTNNFKSRILPKIKNDIMKNLNLEVKIYFITKWKKIVSLNIKIQNKKIVKDIENFNNASIDGKLRATVGAQRNLNLPCIPLDKIDELTEEEKIYYLNTYDYVEYRFMLDHEEERKKIYYLNNSILI